GRRARRSRRREGEPLITRQALHAWRLAFAHPVDGSPMAFEAPVPEDFEHALDRLRSSHDVGR
ncbi:MAG: RluA family pseudouridine synthase, partial [Candidatus Tectimicrobiota bacterium]